MLDVAPTELLLVGIVALLVIGPKDLPRAMRFVGKWVGKARGIARQFRSGLDTMIRESELAEMEKQWAAENERIMREHPPTAAALPPAEHQPYHDANQDVPPVLVEQPAMVEQPIMVEQPAVMPVEAPIEFAPEPAAKPKRVRKPAAVVAAPVDTDAAAKPKRVRKPKAAALTPDEPQS